MTDWALVTAVIDRLIPADDFPSAGQAGVAAQLAAQAAADQRTTWRDLLTPGFAALAREAGPHGFAALAEDEQDTLLAAVGAGRTTTAWPVDPATFHATLLRLTCEHYYGTRGTASWAMLGYSPALRRDSALRGPSPELLLVRRLADAAETYDAVVVGVGAGGGVAAAVLAQSGLQVLAADRGDYLSYEQIGTDHLRNFRLSTHGHNLPPYADAGPRFLNDTRIEHPWQPGWSALPHTIGGGTRVYQGMAWRLLPDDFRLATKYGVPDGSSLADWPIAYADLEPFYTEAEWALGVCGDAGSHRNRGPRSRPYPMGPLPDNTEAQVLRRAAARLGWSTGPVPMLINSVPRGGRGRCGQCGECVGFACPTDAKNGPFNTVLPVAQRTGNLTLVGAARATEVTTDRSGAVTGVAFADERTGERRTLRAGHVVVACSAVETARLLLASRCDAHPGGLGNGADQVGRHLQGHVYVGAYGTFADPVIDGPGPNVRIATCDHLHAVSGLLGGVLANEVVKLPILHWNWALPPDAPRAGLAGKQAMARLYRRTSHLFGPIQEIPQAGNRVTLAEAVRDRHGVPVPRIGGTLHPDNRGSADLLIARARQWLTEAGAERVWSTGYRTTVSAGQHQAGTCRMGSDPAVSVTDPWGRVHGHPNLWIMDASVHVTNGGFNPVLTVLALAFRNARHLAQVA
ncbi:GMC oxidoreductase [Actinoplanes sp. KI2]|uniref:GMC family oxidoreductase n=1 Tax=Actinoplanes sp. KI2 TaxID=2983315 RepID=UPI0021D5D252|nr:GMC family oxidoreductase [Actinoplanes sp. KI2]MCU7727806.1 GMC oxidoreductase [Actinoplanes sp. KI2]